MTLDPEQPEYAPTYRLGEWIAQRRREIGEARWQQLCNEFTAPPGASATTSLAGDGEAGSARDA